MLERYRFNFQKCFLLNSERTDNDISEYIKARFQKLINFLRFVKFHFFFCIRSV